MSANAGGTDPPDAGLMTLQDVVLRTGVPVRVLLEWIRNGLTPARSSPEGWLVNIDDIRSAARTQPVGSRHEERLPVPATRVSRQPRPVPPPGFAGTPFEAALAEQVHRRIEHTDREHARITRIMRELVEAQEAAFEETALADDLTAAASGWTEETRQMVQRQLRQRTPPPDLGWIQAIAKAWREERKR